jgi:hypothetical protein
LTPSPTVSLLLTPGVFFDSFVCFFELLFDSFLVALLSHVSPLAMVQPLQPHNSKIINAETSH